MPVDTDLYRKLAGSFPTGVAIVTTRDASGAPKGLTTQSFVGLSVDPPLMLVSIDSTSRTLAALRESRGFVVNFIKIGAEDIATRFASKSDDKFSGIASRRSEHAFGAPILQTAALAYAECVTERSIEVGDHVMFIGRVEGGAVLGGVPLLYYHRTYAPWPEEKPAPPVS